MQLSTKITINKSIDDVWNILTAEFLSLDKWMAAIETTVEKKQGSKAKNAPVIGRIAAIGAAAAKGASLDETITYINEQDYILDIDTDLIDVPGVSPMKGYMTRIQLTSVGENSCEVSWVSTSKLGLLGYVLYFVIKKSLGAGFYRGLEELKAYAETGKGHPRKQAALDKLILTSKLQPA